MLIIVNDKKDNLLWNLEVERCSLYLHFNMEVTHDPEIHNMLNKP